MSETEPNLVTGPHAVAHPPTQEEIEKLFGAVVTAAAPPEGLTELQAMVITSLVEAMAGPRLDPYACRHVTPDELAPLLESFSLNERMRVIHDMVLVALLVRPFSAETGARIASYAAAIGVDVDAGEDIRSYGPASYDAALVDFARNGYAGRFLEESRPVLYTDHDIGDGWGVVDADPVLAQRWADLEHCPDGSLGRGVFDFYVSRQFVFPGLEGSAPPLLAQHDWVHVLGDYGTTLESELEVFGLIARADDDPRGFSLLAMVIGLFETGQVTSGAGLFEADTGHLSSDGMAVRLADAMRRGALINAQDTVETSLLGVDWFAHADLPIAEAREVFGMLPKSAKAVEAGSVGTWDERGFSDYQLTVCDLTVLERYV